MDATYIAFAAIFLATFIRTYLPARAARAKAKREGKSFKWDHRYSLSAGSSLGLALVIVALIFTGFQIPDAHPLFVFMSAFSYGFMQNQIFNQIMGWWKEIHA